MQNSVAAGISAIIEKRCLNRAAVARKAGFSPQQFYDMLHGRKAIRAEYLPSIAGALGVEVNAIFEEGAISA